MTRWTLGIIGGSGLYALDGLADVRTESVRTPWGAPSAPLTRGALNGVELVFLPRHGAGHAIPPSDIPFRANIAALKQACSLRKIQPPFPGLDIIAVAGQAFFIQQRPHPTYEQTLRSLASFLVLCIHSRRRNSKRKRCEKADQETNLSRESHYETPKQQRSW